MIEVESLERMADKLYEYDVTLDGWEGDPEGSNPMPIEHNLKHVGEHLAGVLAFKDFTDPEVISKEIAPDYMQYGLRIARWGRVALSNVLLGDQYIADATKVSLQLDIPSRFTLPATSLIFANGILMGQQMHDEEHHSSHADATSMRKHRLQTVSSTLINIASSSDYWPGADFDIEQAFDDRLTVLQKRIAGKITVKYGS